MVRRCQKPIWAIRAHAQLVPAEQLRSTGLLVSYKRQILDFKSSGLAVGNFDAQHVELFWVVRLLGDSAL